MLNWLKKKAYVAWLYVKANLHLTYLQISTFQPVCLLSAYDSQGHLSLIAASLGSVKAQTIKIVHIYYNPKGTDQALLEAFFNSAAYHKD